MKEKAILGILLTDFVLSGAGSSLSLKVMSTYEIPSAPQSPPVPYNHPYMQTLCMFIGESMCLCLFLIQRCISKGKNRRAVYAHLKSPSAEAELGSDCPKQANGQQSGDKRPYMHKDIFKFAVPTICDLISSTLFNMSIFYSDVSVYQMLRNLSMFFVAMLSACIWRDFRKRFDLQQCIGIILLLLGAFLVGYSAIAFQQHEKARNPVLGVLLVIGGTFILALFYISEEIFLRKIKIEPILGVGIEGCWGLLFNAILLPIYNFVPCPWSENGGNFENTAVWAYEVFVACKIEIAFHLTYIVFTLMFNQAGLELTSRASASFRTTFDACRTIIIFILSMCFGWEKWNSKSTPIKIVGFVTITAGVLLYNNILVVIPYFRCENAQANKGKWIHEMRVKKSNNLDLALDKSREYDAAELIAENVLDK